MAELPEEIGRLTGLRRLRLARNHLTWLPSSFDRLTELTDLDLSGNHITVFPDVLCGLTKLRTLNLAGNALGAVSPQVRALAMLSQLDLTGNRLTALPDALLGLSELQELFLHGNAGLNLPPEVLGPSAGTVASHHARPEPAQEILRYYFGGRQEKPRKPLAEAKVLVVGEAWVGKTSLVRALIRDEPCRPGEPKTESIAATRWELKVPHKSGRELAVGLNVWDFGGQEIMHATHQFFLTRWSLYLLVLAARTGEVENNLAYWLRVIRSYGDDSPVLVVINKSEPPNHLDLNETGLRREFGASFRGVLRVSCRTLSGVDALRAAVRRELATLPHVFDELPAEYFAVKGRLEERARREKFLDYQAYVRLCRAKGLLDGGSSGPSCGCCTTSGWC